MSSDSSLNKVVNEMYAPFFGTLGITCAMVFTALGSSHGILKSGSSIAMMGIMKPSLVIKALIPVIMASIVSIYGLVIAVVLAGKVKVERYGDYDALKGAAHFASGLTCGLCGLGAGYAIGIAGEQGVRALAYQPKVYIGMILILIFSEVFFFPSSNFEVLGLYGMIISLVIASD